MFSECVALIGCGTLYAWTTPGVLGAGVASRPPALVVLIVTILPTLRLVTGVRIVPDLMVVPVVAAVYVRIGVHAPTARGKSDIHIHYCGGRARIGRKIRTF